MPGLRVLIRGEISSPLATLTVAGLTFHPDALSRRFECELFFRCYGKKRAYLVAGIGDGPKAQVMLLYDLVPTDDGQARVGRLQKALRTGSTKEVALALRDFSDAPDLRLVPDVIEALEQVDFVEQSIALMAIGRTAPVRDIPKLVSLLHSDRHRRPQVLNIIGRAIGARIEAHPYRALRGCGEDCVTAAREFLLWFDANKGALMSERGRSEDSN